jgi:hypothetical protein
MLNWVWGGMVSLSEWGWQEEASLLTCVTMILYVVASKAEQLGLALAVISV